MSSSRATATMRSPSVLTMSGSSTPASWMFVWEKSGALSRPAVALAGVGAAGIPPRPSVIIGIGGATSCTGDPRARVGTPVPPSKRRAFVRA